MIRLTATGTRVSSGTVSFYLPPDRGDVPVSLGTLIIRVMERSTAVAKLTNREVADV